MINKIISAICKKLYEQYGEDYEIYKENIEQGLNEPCFFVQCLDPNTEPTITDRKRKQHLFMIQYFPHTSEKYAEINDVIETLDDLLEMIVVDGAIIRGKDASAKTVDKVLNYQIVYDFFVIKASEREKMEQLEIKNEVGEWI